VTVGRFFLTVCYVHKRFSPTWGETANRSRCSIEPVSAWTAPRRETISLEASVPLRLTLCAVTFILPVRACVCDHCSITSQGSTRVRLQRCWWHTAERITRQNQIKSLILCLCYSKVYRRTALVLMHEPVKTRNLDEKQRTQAHKYMQNAALNTRFNNDASFISSENITYSS